ncbi:MAG: hypothetical protein C5B50_15900 [Verrucomicrobia bacterium]|nr:MAG: hypothetical protein C5B50_15900 [Verrucomicrobiota bacterium]
MALPTQENSGRCSHCGAELTGSAAHTICPACALADALGDSHQTASETMLQSQEGTESSLHKPVSPEPKTMPPSFGMIEKPGDRIGRYKLLQELGEGGMGVVWMAEQTEPVRRRVALKVIKLGMDTRQVIGRFEAERQALALMDHPNIAKVLDAGATETGRPFFVMELVKGTPITDYCDREKLSTRERLELFVQVCQAIQHAHQKGIIHRDIKPSNILVTLNDGEPVPKIIDFGIAKATGGQVLTDKTVFTAIEQFIGTPAYMSPEQAEMNAMDIDTRSDIYALGVLLYELLTGSTPFDSKALIAKGIEEIRRVIREEEPPRPSTRLSTLDAGEQTTVARQRQSEPPKLVGMIRGDLDWIVMKTLEKDRRRRYDTANGLAMEVQRYLRNEAVVARPPSQIYRVQKLISRNKLAFAAGACVATALILGLVGTTWQAWRATQEKRLADVQRQRAEREAVRADKNAAAERVERDKAELARRQANEALSMALVTEGDRLVREKETTKALAYFARGTRLNPGNLVAATRIVSLLNQSDFPLPVRTPAGFISRAAARRSSPDVRLVGKAIVDKKSGKEISRLNYDGEFDSGQEPTFSDDGQKIAVSCKNSTEVFYTHTGERVMPSLPTPLFSSSGPAFTPDSRQLVIARKSVQVWDLLTGKSGFATPETPNAFDFSISGDGRLLATSLRTKEAQIWNLVWSELSSEKFQIGDPSGGLCGIELNLSGQFLLTVQARQVGGTNKLRSRFWDVRPGRAVPLTLSLSGLVEFASYDTAGRQVVAVGKDGAVFVFSAEDGSRISNPAIAGHRINSAVFSHDASLLALGTGDGVVGVWDLSRQNLLWSQPAHSSAVSALVFSPDGKILLSGEGEKYSWDETALCSVNIFDARSGGVVAKFTNSVGAVECLAVSPDSRSFAVAYKRYRAEIRSLPTAEILGEPLTRNQGWVWETRFSYDGAWLVTSAGGGADAAQLWDARSPKNQPLQRYPHGHGVVSSCFTSDDKLLLTCSSDGTARVWERATKRPVAELLHAAGLRGGCFSPDNREVLTTSEDGTTVVWDIQTGRALSVPFHHGIGPPWASFSPDGTKILTLGGRGNTVAIYPWQAVLGSPPGWLVELAEAVAGVRLNEASVTEFIGDGESKIENLRAILVSADTAGPLVKWGRWYLADRGSRSINFQSTISVHDYSERLAKEENILALAQALDLNPSNSLAYVQLANLVEGERPETAALYRHLAREFGAAPEKLVPSPENQVAKARPVTSSDSDGFLDPRDGATILKKEGEHIKVKGQVVKFGASRSGTFYYLNFAENYKSALTLAFRIDSNPAEFQEPRLRPLVGKTVIVEGTAGAHLGSAQILMQSLSQIKIVDSAANSSQ